MNKPRRQVIKVSPVKARIGPLGFHKYAADFLQAAKSVEKRDSFSPVPYYLYCRAIELVLKAYLLAKGVSVKELKNSRRLGHDLVKALNMAKSLGLDTVIRLKSKEEEEITKANDYYKSKGFEYFGLQMLAYPDLPDLLVLDRCSSRLVTKLKSVCVAAV